VLLSMFVSYHALQKGGNQTLGFHMDLKVTDYRSFGPRAMSATQGFASYRE